MTEEEIKEVIDAVKRESQPVETLEKESDIRAVSSLLAMRGDTLIRAPMTVISQILENVSGDIDTATRALYGATMPFDGFVEGVELKPLGFAIWDAILYDTVKKKFVARSLLNYSDVWTTYADYMDENGNPRGGRIYLSKEGGAYYWDSTEKNLNPVKIAVTQSLTFDFGAQDTEWVIRHNLMRKPAVTVTNSDGVEIVCDIIHTSNNELRLVFGKPTSGTAILT